MTRSQISIAALLLANVDAVAISQLGEWPVAQCVLAVLMPITWLIGIVAGVDQEPATNETNE